MSLGKYFYLSVVQAIITMLMCTVQICFWQFVCGQLALIQSHSRALATVVAIGDLDLHRGLPRTTHIVCCHQPVCVNRYIATQQCGIHSVSKNCAFLFLSELRQISTNFNYFW